MRITFVLPGGGLSGGVRVVAIYAQRLQKRGHHVVVVSRSPRPTLGQNLRSLVRHGRWENPAPEPSHLDGLDVEQRVLPKARPVTDADVPDADVVVATWWETAEWVAKLSPRKGAKVYFIQHDEQTAYGDDMRHMWPRVKATWSLPLHKIVIAKWLVELARERCGDQFVSYVPNAVDLQQFTALPRGKQPTATVGLMYSRTVFKGTDVSLRAYEVAASRLPNLRLVAYGMEAPDPSLPLPSLTRYVQQPPQAEIRNIYSSADAWLFGSRSEGFGLPILEAMACRTPVIGTPTGAAPELLASGGGILVKPENPADMAEAICRVANMSDDQWRWMSNAAYAVANGYTWDDATGLLENALATAIDRASTNPLPVR